jgi:PHP family Zn ribbon phosphoesterase
MAAKYQADLHVHTLLSPCAEIEMIPPLIIAQAAEVGLDLIAITDHNSAENVRAVMEAAKGSPIKVLPGIECESIEGVHVICLFDRAEDAESMQELVYSLLPNLPNQAEKLGNQMVVTAEAEFVRYNERLLLASSELSIDEIVVATEERCGLAIPAHVDRRGYGLYGVLGFLPEGNGFPAVEISKRMTEDGARDAYPDLNGRAIITSSDAHMLADLGCCRTTFLLEHRSASELRLAFEGRDGRKVVECLSSASRRQISDAEA